MVHQVSVIGDGTGEEMMFAGDLDIGDDVMPPEGGGPVMILRTVEVHGPGDGGGGGAQPAEKKKGPD
jgi:hypothetical protein